MAAILDPKPSTANNLKRVTISIVSRLQRHRTWREPSLFSDEQRQRVHISPNSLPYRHLGYYSEGNLHRYILTETRRIVFHGLRPMDTYLDDVTGSRMRMLYRRVVMEAAKKMPSWRMKNLLYTYLGIGISDRKTVIIAPNIYMDYIYPELIGNIGANTFIGEEAMLVTHFFYPDRIEIGPISIGKNCLVGVRSLIAPGVVIGDNVTIGAYAVVTRDVPPGATVLGPKSG